MPHSTWHFSANAFISGRYGPQLKANRRCRCISISRSTISMRLSHMPSRLARNLPNISRRTMDNVRVMLDPAGHPFCLYL